MQHPVMENVVSASRGILADKFHSEEKKRGPPPWAAPRENAFMNN
jgi:hypothetical protein